MPVDVLKASMDLFRRNIHSGKQYIVSSQRYLGAFTSEQNLIICCLIEDICQYLSLSDLSRPDRALVEQFGSHDFSRAPLETIFYFPLWNCL